VSNFLKTFFWLSFLLIGVVKISFGINKNSTSDPSPPVLNRVWIQGSVYTTDTIPSKVTTIPLPYGKNFFMVEFISINYNLEEKLSYSYKLKGVDSTWVFSGDQRRASYANLGPGTYPLKIRVSNDGINWVYCNQNISVLVTPPFWAKWWFNVGVILFVFSLLWVIYQVRINTAIKRALDIADIRRKEAESLRVMMAQDFHDEMGNKLASIIVLVSTLQMLIKDKDKEIQRLLLELKPLQNNFLTGPNLLFGL